MEQNAPSRPARIDGRRMEQNAPSRPARIDGRRMELRTHH